MKGLTRWLPLVLTIAISAGLLAATIWLTSGKDVTDRESGLLQFILFAAGVALSFHFGRLSVTAAAHDMLRPHGRKSVRRIANLAQGVSEFATIIAEQRALLEDQAHGNERLVPFAQVEYAFDTLNVVIRGQLRTATDAIEDWRDVVPEAIEILEEKSEDGQ